MLVVLSLVFFEDFLVSNGLDPIPLQLVWHPVTMPKPDKNKKTMGLL